MRPSFGSQPPARTPLSQQDGAQGLLGNGCGFGSGLSQSPGCGGVRDRPSSSSSSSSSSLSRVSFSFSDSSGYQSATSLSSSCSSSSLSSLPLFQTASSLTSSSSSVLPPLPPLSQSLVNPPPKLVPIFKNKHPSRHVNVALLRVQKQREQLGGGGEERKRRVTLPSFGKNRPATAPPLPPPTSSSFPSLPIPLPVFPHFNRRPKPHISPGPPPSAHPKVKHISSLSPASKTQPGFILAPKPEMKLKTKSSSKTSVRFSSESKTVCDSSHKLQQEATKRASAAPTEAPQPATLSDISNKDSSHSRQEVVFESKPKKSRAAVRDVDVEKMARSNQLSRLNSATLSSWLRGRGVLVGAKQKKEELMLKVMSCLAEA
ncbi:flocculation protein FLO11-like [Seriola lalandi dorsalis]|uniref:flocculation protein FLO11-like n=1 Tax=Seriola lalandi dorsalis TaxID=1841481 RepID=UPI000C6F687D|nr:flocculation protein FLO11-like [Seriola lalandi dorsalis]